MGWQILHTDFKKKNVKITYLILHVWHVFSYLLWFNFAVVHLKVARKLVIIEGDLERTEERAELSEG